MRGGGERSAVIHRGTDGDAGRHLVVEETAYFFAEEWCDVVVCDVICAGFGGVDGAGEVAFEETQDGGEFKLVADGDCEGGVAEDLALQVVRGGEELFCGGSEKGVRVAVAVAGGVIAASDELRSGIDESCHSLMKLFAPGGGE